MRRKNKKKSMLLVLLMLIAGISMGYAILNTTLNINGTSKIKDAKWNIYWENPQIVDGSTVTTLPTIDSLKTTASFSVTLNNPGDYYEFTIDAKNAGTIDGMISTISYKLNDTEIGLENPLPAYLNYTVTYSDDVELETNHLLAANTKETYKVRVEFKKNIENNQLPGQEVTLSLKFAVTYAQSDNTASERKKVITYISRQNEGQITIGDVIRIGETEEFYVISSDSEKTVLQGKYNLLVGHEIKNYRDIGLVSTDIPRYGLQDAEATIGTDGNYKYVAPFSDDAYWMSGSDLLSPYSENDTIYYDSSNGVFKYRQDDSVAYPYIYDENSVVYQYISGENGYVDKLKDMGAPSSITGRIITYEEVMNIRNIDYNILYSHKASYWVANPHGINGVYYIATTLGDISHTTYSNINGYGIRPVIEIPTSALK